MSEERIPDVTVYFELFRRYHARHIEWGALHLVLADRNLDDASVRFCETTADLKGDTEGKELARLLLRMSGTQRGRISKEC